ncbi:hypothetical protein B0I18_101716 [Taibaiella chishuiensis]|uniref:Uncharacterized protein n=1 Tax=Taibaiella chishuiensis TaxID=1434707 RepID=A0A2P8DBG4_9BACT|nr:hypothetical protein B0I18_101716 [Taibaiella chishuiensis]
MSATRFINALFLKVGMFGCFLARCPAMHVIGVEQSISYAVGDQMLRPICTRSLCRSAAINIVYNSHYELRSAPYGHCGDIRIFFCSLRDPRRRETLIKYSPESYKIDRP